jgi:hypothetical protein
MFCIRTNSLGQYPVCQLSQVAIQAMDLLRVHPQRRPVPVEDHGFPLV